MKKIILGVLLSLALVGCSSSNNKEVLSCTYESQGYGVTEKIEVEVVGEGNAILSMKQEITISNWTDEANMTKEDYANLFDVIVLQSQQKEDTEATYESREDSVYFKMEIDYTQLTDEDFDVDQPKTMEEMKATLEADGAECK